MDKEPVPSLRCGCCTWVNMPEPIKEPDTVLSLVEKFLLERHRFRFRAARIQGLNGVLDHYGLYLTIEVGEHLIRMVLAGQRHSRTTILEAYVTGTYSIANFVPIRFQTLIDWDAEMTLENQVAAFVDETRAALPAPRRYMERTRARKRDLTDI